MEAAAHATCHTDELHGKRLPVTVRLVCLLWPSDDKYRRLFTAQNKWSRRQSL